MIYIILGSRSDVQVGMHLSQLAKSAVGPEDKSEGWFFDTGSV